MRHIQQKEVNTVTIYILIAAIVIVSVFIKSKNKLPFLIFSVTAEAFQAFSCLIPESKFHLTGAFLDLAVIMLIVRYARMNLMTATLGTISALSVLANLSGWLLYEKGFNAELYDAAFVSVYSVVLLIALFEWWRSVRANTRNTSLRSNYN